MQWYMLTFLISSGFLFTTLIFGFIGWSTILKFLIRDQTALRRRNQIYEFYLKLPIPLDFRVYFFNVSNPDEVQTGGIPELIEMGPYCFDAYKEKIDIVENEKEDTLTYTPYETYYFNEEKSAGLSPDDTVTILHPLILGMVNAVKREHPQTLNIVNKAMKQMFQDPESIYLTAKVRDILFDGLLINCTGKDFSSKAVCSQIKAQLPDIKEPVKDMFYFSLLGSRNGTLPKRIKVMRGISNSSNLGRVVEVNDEKKLDIWSTEECNRFHGTDGWIFPPFLKKEQGIWSFSVDLCRSIHAFYVEDTDFRGISTRLYHATLGDQSTEPADKCYCFKPELCLPKGLMDLTKCQGAPIYASLPHFAESDPALLEQVRGLNPVKENHIVRIVFEPMLGMPVNAQKRMQFNLPIGPVPKISFMKTLPEAVHPIFWIEEGVILDGALFKQLSMVFVMLKLCEIFKYLFLCGSLIGMGVGGFFLYTNKKSSKITTLVKSAESMKNGKNDSGTETRSSTAGSAHENNNAEEMNNVEDHINNLNRFENGFGNHNNGNATQIERY